MIKFYLHVPDLPGWEKMFADMLDKMHTSGLIDGVDEINLCLNGVLSNMEIFLKPLTDSSPKFRLRHVNGDYSKHEWPTVHTVHMDALADDTDEHIVGYAHLKGLSRPATQPVTDWRNLLVYWTIERWRDNIELIEQGYETSGINWLDYPHPHYSGNFWWAQSNYIRRLRRVQDPATIVPGTVSNFLPNVRLDPGNYRYENEAWIGSGKPRQAVLHMSPARNNPDFHYSNPYPPELYRED